VHAAATALRGDPGRLDVLVNNVPIVLAGEPVEAIAAEHLVRIFHGAA
jgi:NAD(P)-dependent dehydrogenase (short-subunit alcohol dehydrogenase family)